jgi:hypothetical protein
MYRHDDEVDFARRKEDDIYFYRQPCHYSVKMNHILFRCPVHFALIDAVFLPPICNLYVKIAFTIYD